MALADTASRNAAGREKEYKLAGGAGLHLLVIRAGGKRWRLKYDLAKATGVGRAIAARFELGENVGAVQGAVQVEAMRSALEAAGARFMRRAGRVGVTVPEVSAP